jgi:RNA 2',3'-cyclic 3'-phosphodiesterase
MASLSGGDLCRCFFAVWPDDSVLESLHRVAVDAHKTCGGRVMRRDTLHLTLAFLGDIPVARVTDAKRVADRITAAPFDLAIDSLGYWRHNRILWAGGAVPPRLTFIAEALGEGLRAAGFSLDMRPFAPHVTLLRDAVCAETPDLPKSIDWPVREFVLAESSRGHEGARYEAISRWPLVQAG